MDDCILDILGALEDLLCDEDDDGAGNQWNSCERKEGTGLRDDIDAFEQRALGEIDSGEWDADEFPLRLTKMHCDFVNLVEAHLESVLSKQGLSCSSFIEKLEDIESREGWTWARDGAKEVIALLLEVDNFSMWGASMKKKAAARQRRQRK